MTTDSFETLKPGDRVYLKSADELSQFVVRSLRPDLLPFLGTIVTICSVAPLRFVELPKYTFGPSVISHRMVPPTAGCFDPLPEVQTPISAASEQEMHNFLGF